MAQDTGQIVVGADGEIHTAPLATTAPTTPTAAYAAGWTDAGYATEEGVKFRDTKEVTKLMGWQEFYALRHIVTSKDFQVIFVLRQFNADNVKLALGGGAVTEPSAGIFKYVPPSPESLDERELGITWRDGSKDYRLIIPKGRAIETVETSLVRTDSANLPITFEVLGTSGVDPFYWLTDDAAFDPTP
jgi:hypothetical protein